MRADERRGPAHRRRHGARYADGVVINAGAYSHSSLALRDALVGVSVPFVEVHVSNVFAREPERRHSSLAAALGESVGLGVHGYELALRGLVAAYGRRSGVERPTAAAASPRLMAASPCGSTWTGCS